MTRTVGRIAAALSLALALGGLVIAANTVGEDVPIIVTFGDTTTSPTTCAEGAGWCGNGEFLAELVDYGVSEQETVGGLYMYLARTNVGRVAFDFGAPVTGPDNWCFEACPSWTPAFTPNFAADPIKVVELFDVPGWSPPNYNFFNPAACEKDLTSDGLCPNDFIIKLQTAKKEYRLRFSPNVWRVLTGNPPPPTPPQTIPYGVMGVAYNATEGTWVLKNLMAYPSAGGGQPDPCPVVLERKDTVKGLTTWKFGGCYNMPFELTLTRP